jgi:hypothetical protein
VLIATSVALRLPFAINKYADHYFNNDPALYQSLLSQAKPPALVFMGQFFSATSITRYDATMPYRKVSITYPPSPADAIIFARDMGSHNKALIEFYPNRNVYTELNGVLTLIQPATGAKP